MTQPIDTRVVEMKFDNAAFEKGVKSTMDSLEKLDKTITDSVKASNYTSTLSRVSGIVGKLLPVSEFSSAASAIGNTITSIFSKTADAVATVSKVGLASLTALGGSVTALAASGGMKRALNIEQAQFQLKGLMGDAYDWKKIEEDLNYGVKDTAYGLDSAAKAAAQLSASGVQLGDDMKKSLRGISGVAAMTNQEYDTIAHIFTTVAGNGRLMGMQLTQMASYGLNAAATLRDYFNEVQEGANYTEADIRDMVSKGEIDFDTFAKAMDNAFGEHAKEANKTFTGAMSNVKAALSRIGADFATPFLDNTRQVFVALIPLLNNIKSSMKPIYDTTKVGMEAIREKVVGILDAFAKFSKVPTEEEGVFFEPMKRGFEALIRIGEHFGNIFSVAFGKFFDSLGLISKTGNPLYDLALNLEKIADFVDSNFNINRTLLELGPMFTDVSNTVKMFGSAIAEAIPEFSKTFVKVIENASPIVAELVKTWDAFVRALVRLGGPAFNFIVSAIGTAFELLNSFSDTLWQAGIRSENIDAFLNDVTDAILGFSKSVAECLPTVETFSGVLDFLGGIVKWVADGFKESFPDGFGGLFSGGSDIGAKFVEALANAFKFLGDTIAKTGILDFISDLVKNVRLFDVLAVLNTSALTGGLFSLLQSVGNIGTIFSNIATGGIAKVLGLNPALISLKNSLLVMQGTLNAKSIMYIALAIAALAGSMLLLSSLNPGQLLQSGMAIAMLGGVLGSIFRVVSDTSQLGSTMKLGSIVSILLAIGTAFALMAVTMKILSSINVKGLPGILIGMTLIVGSLLVLINAIGSLPEKTVLKGAGVLATIGIAFLTIAASMKILATIQLESFKSIFAGLLGIVLSISIIMLSLSSLNASQLATSMLSITAMSVLMLSIAAAMKILSTISVDGMLTAAGGLLGVITILVAATAILSKGSIFVGAPALLLLAAAMLALAPALALMSAIPVAGLTVALGALASVLIMLGVASAVIDPVKLAGVSLGLLSIAASAVAFGASLALIGAGAVLIAMAFSEIIATLGTVGTAIEQNARFIGTGIVMLLSAMGEAFSSESSKFIGYGANLLMALVDGIASTMGYVAAKGLETVTNFIIGIASGIGNLIQAGIELAIMFILGVADGLRNTREMMRNAMTVVVNTIGVMFLEGLAEIVKHIPGVGEAWANALKATAKDLDEAANEASSAVKKQFDEKNADILAGTQDTMSSVEGAVSESSGAMPQLTGMLAGAMSSEYGSNLSLDSITEENLSGVMSSFDNVEASSGPKKLAESQVGAYTDAISGMSDAAENESENVVSVMSGVVPDAEQAISGQRWRMVAVGNGIVDGVVDGINQRAWYATAAASNLGCSVGLAALSGAQVNSPSKITIKAGEGIVEGVVVGIHNLESTAYDAANDFGYNTAAALSGYTDLLEAIDWDASPIITPVLDTSMIETGLRQMDGLFTSNQVSMAGWANARIPYGFAASSRIDSSSSQTIYNTYLDYTADSSATDMVRDMTRKFKMANLLGG